MSGDRIDVLVLAVAAVITLVRGDSERLATTEIGPTLTTVYLVVLIVCGVLALVSSARPVLVAVFTICAVVVFTATVAIVLRGNVVAVPLAVAFGIVTGRRLAERAWLLRAGGWRG